MIFQFPHLKGGEAYFMEENRAKQWWYYIFQSARQWCATQDSVTALYLVNMWKSTKKYFSREQNKSAFNFAYIFTWNMIVTFLSALKP